MASIVIWLPLAHFVWLRALCGSVKYLMYRNGERTTLISAPLGYKYGETCLAVLTHIPNRVLS